MLWFNIIIISDGNTCSLKQECLGVSFRFDDDRTAFRREDPKVADLITVTQRSVQENNYRLKIMRTNRGESRSIPSGSWLFELSMDRVDKSAEIAELEGSNCPESFQETAWGN